MQLRFSTTTQPTHHSTAVHHTPKNRRKQRGIFHFFRSRCLAGRHALHLNITHIRNIRDASSESYRPGAVITAENDIFLNMLRTSGCSNHRRDGAAQRALETRHVLLFGNQTCYLSPQGWARKRDDWRGRTHKWHIRSCALLNVEGKRFDKCNLMNVPLLKVWWTDSRTAGHGGVGGGVRMENIALPLCCCFSDECDISSVWNVVMSNKTTNNAWEHNKTREFKKSHAATKNIGCVRFAMWANRKTKI